MEKDDLLLLPLLLLPRLPLTALPGGKSGEIEGLCGREICEGKLNRVDYVHQNSPPRTLV